MSEIVLGNSATWKTALFIQHDSPYMGFAEQELVLRLHDHRKSDRTCTILRAQNRAHNHVADTEQLLHWSREFNTLVCEVIWVDINRKHWMMHKTKADPGLIMHFDLNRYETRPASFCTWRGRAVSAGTVQLNRHLLVTGEEEYVTHTKHSLAAYSKGVPLGCPLQGTWG